MSTVKSPTHTRSNAPHPRTPAEHAHRARMGRGKEARLYYGLHALMENRNALLVGFDPDAWRAGLS